MYLHLKLSECPADVRVNERNIGHKFFKRSGNIQLVKIFIDGGYDVIAGQIAVGYEVHRIFQKLVLISDIPPRLDL